MVEGTIKNLIFDLGGVVIRFDGNYFLDREGITDPEDRKLLMEVLFAGPDWPRLDLGELDEAELLALAEKKLPPRLHPAAERLVLHWADPVEIIPVMREFILAVRGNGLKTYLLTNSPKSIHRVLDVIRADSLFDGIVISSEIGLAKPGHEIFEHALKTFGLNGEESLFLDDNMKNVWAAGECGIRAAWYKEPGEKKLVIAPRREETCSGMTKLIDTFEFPYLEESAWFDYDHMAAVNPRGTLMVIDANGDVFADYMDPAGQMHECTVGEGEDEWEADNFPVEENGHYTYGLRKN